MSCARPGTGHGTLGPRARRPHMQADTVVFFALANSLAIRLIAKIQSKSSAAMKLFVLQLALFALWRHVAGQLFGFGGGKGRGKEKGQERDKGRGRKGAALSPPPAPLPLHLEATLNVTTAAMAGAEAEWAGLRQERESAFSAFKVRSAATSTPEEMDEIVKQHKEKSDALRQQIDALQARLDALHRTYSMTSAALAAQTAYGQLTARVQDARLALEALRKSAQRAEQNLTAMRAALLASNQLAASKEASGCWGVSPSGVRWAYLMPKHTGSATGWSYLHDQLKIKTCAHVHSNVVQYQVGATFTFAFVQNPYRRLLSAAAWLGVISGGKVRFEGRSRRDEAKMFSKWLLAHRQAPLASQVEFIGKTNALSFVGRTATIERDLPRALEAAGYREALPAISRSHCVSSCAVAGERMERTTQFHAHELRAASVANQTSMFSERAVQAKVQEWFRADFDAFSFARDPARMYDL